MKVSTMHDCVVLFLLYEILLFLSVIKIGGDLNRSYVTHRGHIVQSRIVRVGNQLRRLKTANEKHEYITVTSLRRSRDRERLFYS